MVVYHVTADPMSSPGRKAGRVSARHRRSSGPDGWRLINRKESDPDIVALIHTVWAKRMRMACPSKEVSALSNTSRCDGTAPTLINVAYDLSHGHGGPERIGNS